MSQGTTAASIMDEYADSYKRVAQTLREALLSYSNDQGNRRAVVKEIFERIDINSSGVLTSEEMIDFLQSPELNIFQSVDRANFEKFSQMLIEQIDIDR